ncbi:hypothetical protein F511_32405 [Dorcoceras hygrometricum]|uniref:Rhodopsin n=1 Tax=Dorcoceras hygrometricum TaxID=472368 RepID=A0A2Z7BZ16_9LAMI|nr:hypothetical protein F511_32405 [Dorcoceras hygrometricum]
MSYYNQNQPPVGVPPPQGKLIRIPLCYPQEGYGKDSYPPQGYPAQGYPQQGYPQQGYPPPQYAQQQQSGRTGLMEGWMIKTIKVLRLYLFNIFRCHRSRPESSDYVGRFRSDIYLTCLLVFFDSPIAAERT